MNAILPRTVSVGRVGPFPEGLEIRNDNDIVLP